jgi:hypothetical protein
MKQRRCIALGVMAILLSTGGLCSAANDSQAGPGSGATDKSRPAVEGPKAAHLAARREMVRNQQDQRVTPEKKKAAAEALKAERLKVYNAKQAVKKSQPQTMEIK